MPKNQGSRLKKEEENKSRAVISGKHMQTKKDKKDNTEDISKINNLINAARIVESSSPKINKKTRGKALTRGKEQGKPAKQSSVEIEKAIPPTLPGKKASPSTAKKEDGGHDSSTDESDLDNRNEIADLKKTVNAMMAKIEKLETEGYRKRKKKRKVPDEATDEVTDLYNSDKEQNEEVDKPKQEKFPKKEKEAVTSKAIENVTSHAPMANFPQMSNVFQHLMQLPSMYNNVMMQPNMQPNMFDSLFPIMAAMMPPQPGEAISLNTPAMMKDSTSNTKHNAIEGQRKGPESNVNNRTDSKKGQRKNKAVTNSEKEKDGNESDVSEVYGPTIKDAQLAQYLGSGPIATPSFIRFVDEITKDDITKDERTLQSTVISSTRKNADNAATAKTEVEQKSKEFPNATVFKRSNSINNKQPIGSSSNVAGILLNLFPQPKSDGGARSGGFLSHGLEGLEQPDINNALRTMLHKQEELSPQLQQHQQLTRIGAAESKIRNSISPAVNFLNKRVAPPIQRNKLSTEINRRRYLDNKVWFRDCLNKPYLQDQDGDT